VLEEPVSLTRLEPSHRFGAAAQYRCLLDFESLQLRAFTLDLGLDLGIARGPCDEISKIVVDLVDFRFNLCRAS